MKKILLFLLLFDSQLCFCITTEQVLNQIERYLVQLKDSPTGAIDADGVYTKDADGGLNCAGFVKWIADGFYAPLAEEKRLPQKYMSLRRLREKHPAERGTPDILNYEDSRDPYFGLDWSRNIAMCLAEIRGEPDYSYKSHDVTDSSVASYAVNCGYSVYDIPNVIKTQYALFPNRLYIGSINGFYGTSPRLWQHYHVVVFIPYAKDGEAHIAVLERNKKTSFQYLWRRYPNTFCHLVWLDTVGDFELMLAHP